MLAVLTAAAAFAIPGVASADCTVQNSANGSDAAHPHDFTYAAAQEFSGSFAQARQGDFVQVPFTVPANTTAVRIRYCWDSAPSGNTLDIGVYEPLHSGDTVPGVPERRGWSGSAVRDLSIAENGFSPKATYEAGRRDLDEGYTTRAYKPGPIPEGNTANPWTAELGLAYLQGGLALDPQVTGPVAWRMRVETSSDPDWADDPYQPATLDTASQNPNPGWYAGDLHAHGEEEPGNALMQDSFDYAFKPIAQGGSGVDFLGLVDHNNDISRGEIGRYQAAHPGKLVIPGTEVTTYDGHWNAIGSSDFPDFRGGSIYKWDQALVGGLGDFTPGSPIQGPAKPATQFPVVDGGGGWSQINHPTIYQDAPAACRGCFWNWSGADTDYSKVDAIEIQNGPADIAGGQNPFTVSAIQFYEAQLADGNHMAVVGGSDAHKGSVVSSPLDVAVGGVATEVYANQLSHDAIVSAIKGQHTYVKPYGNSAPDLDVQAHSPGAPDAIIGDDLSGQSASFDVSVTGATASKTARPGTYSLNLLKDGAAVAGQSVPINGDALTHTFKASSTGRYSFEVLRQTGAVGMGNPPRYEDYSSPIWFTKGTNLKLSKAKVDKKKGTAKVSAKVAGKGKLKLSGSNIKGATVSTAGASTKNLNIKPTGKAAKDLKKKGKAKVKAKVTFTPTGGEKVSATQKVTLKKKVGKHHRGR
ncbi:hypothetical protein BH10ACT11_BH10ACT11_13310 [soil metagenome]